MIINIFLMIINGFNNNYALLNSIFQIFKRTMVAFFVDIQ